MNRPKPKPLEQQIQAIAGALDRSVITIRTWIREGMDPYSPDSISDWYQWKESRRLNKRNHERPARRVRPPI
jgi:hypothetical protein